MAKKRSVTYMTVTADEYELPIYVADTVEELAERYGVSKGTIYTAVCLGKNGKRNGYMFVKVKNTGE